jgi:exosortase/archaeosortase family protein
MKDVDERLHRTAVFLGKLLLAGLVFRAVILVAPSTYQLQSAFADMITWMINIAGIEAISTGTHIFTDKSVYVIVQDCLGWKSMAAFLGLMWASTKRTLEYANFILAGIGALFVANIFRVFTTVYLAEAGIISFEIIHGVLWRWSLTVIVLGLWIYWLKMRKDENRFDSRIREHLSDLNQRE